MAPTHLDYDPLYVAAARSVLLEVAHVLAGYRGQIVLVGGWVPELILPSEPLHHVGSLDVDLALDHRAFRESVYKAIERLLFERGYTLGEQPFIFWRTVLVGGQAIRVELDLLAGEYEGAGRSHRTQRIRGLHARKARGCDLAFDLHTVVTLEGRLPNGALAHEYLPHVRHGLVREGLRALGAAFSSPEHLGPRCVADFEAAEDVEERRFLERDAYERVQELLRSVGRTE